MADLPARVSTDAQDTLVATAHRIHVDAQVIEAAAKRQVAEDYDTAQAR